jgi:hypothetical protein
VKVLECVLEWWGGKRNNMDLGPKMIDADRHTKEGLHALRESGQCDEIEDLARHDSLAWHEDRIILIALERSKSNARK